MDETYQHPEAGKQHSNQEKREEGAEEHNIFVEEPNTISVLSTHDTHLEGKSNNQAFVGTKRFHISASSDSYKEAPNAISNNVLAVISTASDPVGWKKVQKKKGKKDKASASNKV